MAIQDMLSKSVIALLACLVAAVTPVGAVIITGGDGGGNTTAQSALDEFPDFDLFDNVGLQGSGSAVYLGDSWFLTAFHINGAGEPGGVEIGGVTFARDVGTPTVQLMNPSDNSLTDLRMFRTTNAPPGLPAVTIGTSTPAVGDDVVMVGYGADREPGLTTWSVDTDVDPNVWSESDFSGSDTTASGYKQEAFASNAESRDLRWGTNTVTRNHVTDPDNLIYENSGSGTVLGFATEFNSGVSGNEAQATDGDSGGAVFWKNTVTDEWELVGILNAVTEFSGQPSLANVFGTDTFSVDLTLLHDQIESIRSVPEPGSAMILGGLAAAWLGRRPRRGGRRG